MIRNEKYTFEGVDLEGDPRFIRQQDILPLDILSKLEVAVVGVGAGGRPCAITLGSMGINKLTLIDFDVIDEHNCSLQGYSMKDLGKYKVNACRQSVIDVLGDKHWEDGYLDMDDSKDWSSLRLGIHTPHIIVCGVDSMEIRRDLWDWVVQECPSCMLYVDGRMSAETIRILTVPMHRDKYRDYYETTLFKDEDAFQDRCTAVGAMHSASIVGNAMILQATKWIRGRGLPMCTDIVVNLLSWDVIRLGPVHNCDPIEVPDR